MVSVFIHYFSPRCSVTPEKGSRRSLSGGWEEILGEQKAIKRIINILLTVFSFVSPFVTELQQLQSFIPLFFSL